MWALDMKISSLSLPPFLEVLIALKYGPFDTVFLQTTRADVTGGVFAVLDRNENYSEIKDVCYESLVVSVIKSGSEPDSFYEYASGESNSIQWDMEEGKMTRLLDGSCVIAAEGSAVVHLSKRAKGKPTINVGSISATIKIYDIMASINVTPPLPTSLCKLCSCSALYPERFVKLRVYMCIYM
jgi:hypothetical protein